LRVEKLDSSAGETIEFDQVLAVGEGADLKIGTPFVKGGKVTATVKEQGRAKKVEIIKFRRRKHHMKATVKEQGRAKKVEIIKFRRRKHHMKKMGHRQSYTELEITGISG